MKELPSKTKFWRKDWRGQGDEEEDVCSYWMTLRTGKGTRIWKRKHYIAFWRTRFGRSYGPVAKQTEYWMNGLHKCQFIGCYCFIFRGAEVQRWAKTLAFLTLVCPFPPRKCYFCALKLVTTIVFLIHFHSLFINCHEIQWCILWAKVLISLLRKP